MSVDNIDVIELQALKRGAKTLNDVLAGETNRMQI